MYKYIWGCWAQKIRQNHNTDDTSRDEPTHHLSSCSYAQKIISTPAMKPERVAPYQQKTQVLRRRPLYEM